MTTPRSGAARRRRFAATFLLLLLALPAAAQETPAARLLKEAVGGREGAAAPAAPEEPQPIPLPEVAAAAERTSQQLRDLRPLAEPLAEITALEEQFEERRERIAAEAERTREGLEQRLDLDALAELERSWTERAQLLSTWRRTLTRRATELEARMEELRSQRSRWTATREQGQEAAAPASLLERVGAILDEIADAQKRIGDRRREVLALQNRVAQAEVLVADILDAIQRERDLRRSQLLIRDAPALWQALRLDSPALLLPGIRGQLAEDVARAGDYFAARTEQLVAQAALLVAVLAGLVELRRRSRRWAEDDPRRPTAVLWERPFSTAVLLLILTAPLFHPSAPGVVRDLIGLAVLVPLLRVLPAVLQPALRPALVALAAFYLVDQARDFLDAAPLLERLVFLLETGAAALLLGRLLAPSRLERLPSDVPLPRGLSLAMRTGLVLLVVSVLANVFGYLNLARILGQGTLQSAYGAVLLFAALRIVRALLRVALRSRWAAGLHMVRRHRALLEQRARWLLAASFLVAWVIGTLQLFAVADTLFDAGKALLEASLSFGTITLSLGDVLAFALTLAAAIWLSRALAFVLDEDVLPRVPLQRGVPTAISTTARYTLLLGGFLLAVAAAGVDLQRFTLLAGALGVGIGFGLQNVVNNFASGLILLYERPIQIGDAIQLEELFGEVRRIGIRSSTVRTWDGAEVIVPNGDLISARVTNWTLSDRHRRMTVKVGVAYGTDPARVLEILLRVARAHPEILDDPPPFARFVGFGESSLDFELWAFVSRFELFFTTLNEVILRVHAALDEAGISIPFPQRDLHLRSADPAAVRGLREEEAPTHDGEDANGATAPEGEDGPRARTRERT